MSKLGGVIFDLDGTLIDSEWNWFESDRRFLNSLGGDYPQALWEKTIGMGGRAMAAMVKDQMGLKQNLDELARIKDDFYLEQAKGRTVVFPEMLKLLQAFKLQGVPMSVASGSSLRVIESVLEETSLRHYFRHVFSADQVERGKPAPDLFLHTAKQMEMKPYECVVFEDSLYGIKAAKAARMTVVAVPFKIHVDNLTEFDTADLLFSEGMREFTAEIVLDWIDTVYCQCDDCSLHDFGRCQD